MNPRVTAPAALATALFISTLITACFPTKKDDENDPASTTAQDVTWYSEASVYRGQNGLRVAYECPDSGSAFTAGTVWGSDIYTDDSSVCKAGVHAGKITFAEGGRVVIEIRPGRESYDSLTRNGVTTLSYPSWSGSYVFP